MDFVIAKIKRFLYLQWSSYNNSTCGN